MKFFDLFKQDTRVCRGECTQAEDETHCEEGHEDGHCCCRLVGHSGLHSACSFEIHDPLISFVPHFILATLSTYALTPYLVMKSRTAVLEISPSMGAFLPP